MKQYELILIGAKEGKNLRMRKPLGVYHRVSKAEIAAKRDLWSRTNTRCGVSWRRYWNGEMRSNFVEARGGIFFSYEINVIGNNRR
jgi:hypothetical protein